MKTLVHPLIVHFPIGLWTASVLFDLLALPRRTDSFYPRAAFALVGLGLLGAAAAVPSGYLDLRFLVAQGIGQAFVDQHRVHQLLALVATFMFLVSFLVRWRRPAANPRLLLVLGLVGAALIGIAGYLGGEMRLVM